MKLKKIIPVIILFMILVFWSSCTRQPDARKYVDKSIVYHGGKLLKHSKIRFDFRQRHYTRKYTSGAFTYTREFNDSLDHIKDILTNEGLIRMKNGDPVELDEKKANAYKNSVNSVIYYALLPFKLNDKQVQKEIIGEAMINGKDYHKIKVTFEQNKDANVHNDIYVYWFDEEDFSMDYFAYRFFSDGGGLRFREAVNVRKINGIKFADYKNYKYDDHSVPVERLDSLFVDGKLELLSEINLKNIEVEIL